MARLVDGSIGITEDHLALRDAVRTLAGRHLGSEQVRVSIEETEPSLPAHWTELAGNGLLALHLPESLGGSGYGLVETCVVAEELGAHLVPGPFLGTVATSAILHRSGWSEGTAEQQAVLAGLGDGSVVAAFTPEVVGACTLRGTREGDRIRISGDLAPTLGLDLADVVVTPVVIDTAPGWVVLRREDWTPRQGAPGLDLARRFGAGSVEARVPADRALHVHPEAPMAIWTLLVSAEACGSAAWSTRTAAEYAAIREQFGQVIGTYQGVKHRCAQMLARTEQARVVTWDAARAVDDLGQGIGSAAEADLAVAVAGAVAPLAAFENAKAAIDTLGAIGYTWEHDASFHLRRSRTMTVLVGGAGRWRQRVGELALAGVRREVGIELPASADAVRTEIRAELDEAAALPAADRGGFLARRGYTVPHLPTPWGKGADAVSQVVIAEELMAAGLEPPSMIIGNWVVPTIIEAGTAEQQQRWLPATLSGEFFWCQLFSEPGAGSDLAALTTRAEKVEGGWRITGTKIWTSAAQYASHGILLARTEPEAAKHAGISYFVLDMTSPGLEIRPIKDLTGSDHFNQVFLDEVFLPDDALVGERGQGWKLARTTLANERVALGNGSLLGTTGESLLERAESLGGAAGAGQDVVRTLGRLLADAQSMSLFGLRSAIRSVTGAQPGAESSIAKLIGVQHTQEAREIAVEWGGVDGLVAEPAGEGPLWWFLNSRNQSIAGGTLDVQRNIIGERLLGLPRS